MKVKRIILQQLNFTAQQVELITGMKDLKCLVICETSTACKTIQPPKLGKDKTKDKEHHDWETAISETNSPQDTH